MGCVHYKGDKLWWFLGSKLGEVIHGVITKGSLNVHNFFGREFSIIFASQLQFENLTS